MTMLSPMLRPRVRRATTATASNRTKIRSKRYDLMLEAHNAPAGPK